MLRFVRVRQHSLAMLIVKGLKRHNFVARRPEIILRSPHYAVYDDNKLVGWVGCTRHPGASYEVRHVTVLPEARGRGVGRKAVEFILNLLKQHGAVYCYAYIRPNNVASQALFAKCGFVKVNDGAVQIYARVMREGL